MLQQKKDKHYIKHNNNNINIIDRVREGDKMTWLQLQNKTVFKREKK